MRYYQVNEDSTFHAEVNGGYLCCPKGPHWGWRPMRILKNDDIVFHNKKGHGVRAVSKVTTIGRHKGDPSDPFFVIPGTECIVYKGRHLSWNAMSPKERRRVDGYASCYEVHIELIMPIAEPFTLLTPNLQCYLREVPAATALGPLRELGL